MQNNIHYTCIKDRKKIFNNACSFTFLLWTDWHLQFLWKLVPMHCSFWQASMFLWGYFIIILHRLSFTIEFSYKTCECLQMLKKSKYFYDFELEELISWCLILYFLLQLLYRDIDNCQKQKSKSMAASKCLKQEMKIKIGN